MDRAEYLKAVNEYFYQGEVLGEALMAAYVTLESDPVRRAKWATLLQLETETKARLRPFLVRLGLSVAQKDVSAEVAEFAGAYAGKSWRQHMEDVAGITEMYLKQFSAIEGAAPEGEREIAHSMVVHETALHRFAELELAGDTERSLADVVAELHWPLAAMPARAIRLHA